MKVIKAKSAGFCFGVKRAVDTVYKQVEENQNLPIYTYGPIIHNEEVVKELEEKGEKLYSGIEQILKEYKKPYHVNHVSSLGSLFFAENEVVDYTSAKASDTKAFADYFLAMLKSGIHLAPSQFEAMFLSTAHTDAVIENTLSKVREYFMK